MEPALEITGLQKTYSNGTQALKGVDVTVPAGDFFALLGPNGAGKTTLIGVTTGLVNKTGGTVKVFGIDIDKEPERARTQIGVVPQEINFNPFEKILDVVVNAAGYYGIPRAVAIPRAEQLLTDLGLYEKRLNNGMQLSGGMKRRLMIARALVHEPKFLVLDEPTAGVDVELRRGMWDFLKSRVATGVTILLTTHYLEEAEQLAKHVAIINKGEIIASGTIKDILGHLTTETVLLDLPTALAADAPVLAELSEYAPKLEDETTLALEIGKGKGVAEPILVLSKHGINVQMVRGKSGRLEEVFLKLTSA